MSAPALAAVVAVGDELLYGSTIDTNGGWLGERLAQVGVPVAARWIVGDDDDAIARALGQALAVADVVVVSGGLGPTPDDHTREAVAAHLGLRLDTDVAVLAELEERFRSFGYTALPEQNAQQAKVPEGATVLRNALGSAPGLMILTGDRMVFLLPGVPQELKGLFETSVAPAVKKTFQGRLRRVTHRIVHTSGIAESVLSERVTELMPEDTGPVSVAFLPKLVGVDVRLTATNCESGHEALDWIERVQGAIAAAWAGHSFDAESGDLVEALARVLVRDGRTLAVAESCTGGHVLERLTDVPGASAYLRGGVVAYDDEVKKSALGVSSALLESHGAVSGPVAEAMALGVCTQLEASTGIAVTGVAGPDGGTEDKPVGTVWYAVAVDGRVSSKQRRFPGDRAQVRVRSAQAALDLLYRTLTREIS